MNEKKKVFKAATSLLSSLNGPIKCQKMVQNNNKLLKFPLFCPQLKKYSVHQHWGGTETRKYSHLRSCNCRPERSMIKTDGDEFTRWQLIYQHIHFLQLWSDESVFCRRFVLVTCCWTDFVLKPRRVLFVFGCRDTKTTNHRRHVIK